MRLFQPQTPFSYSSQFTFLKKRKKKSPSSWANQTAHEIPAQLSVFSPPGIDVSLLSSHTYVRLYTSPLGLHTLDPLLRLHAKRCFRMSVCAGWFTTKHSLRKATQMQGKIINSEKGQGLAWALPLRQTLSQGTREKKHWISAA